ncbi:MAG: hypothetical protein M3Q08_14165 [Pseudomonadota bacterium]|nr:hypothetical protein [Pseudomonadota bacterium]
MPSDHQFGEKGVPARSGSVKSLLHRPQEERSFDKLSPNVLMHYRSLSGASVRAEPVEALLFVLLTRIEVS